MAWLVDFSARVLSLLILFRIAMAWIDPERKTESYRWLFRLTEPVLLPFRRLFYRRGMRFDFSPLVALMAIELARGILSRFLAWIF